MLPTLDPQKDTSLRCYHFGHGKRQKHESNNNKDLSLLGCSRTTRPSDHHACTWPRNALTLGELCSDEGLLSVCPPLLSASPTMDWKPLTVGNFLSNMQQAPENSIASIFGSQESSDSLCTHLWIPVRAGYLSKEGC